MKARCPPVITTVALWQYYVHLAFVRIEHSVCHGSLMTTYKFLNELSTKHESTKFEYQISKTGITFLDIDLYIKNNKLYTKIYRKKKQIVKHSSLSTLNTLNL